MRSSPISGCPRRKTRAPDSRTNIKYWYLQMDGSWGVRDRQEWDRQCSCATTSNRAPLQSRRVQFRSCVLWDPDLGTAIWRWEDGWPVQTHNRWSFGARASWRIPKSVGFLDTKVLGTRSSRKGRTCPEICRELRYIKGLLLTQVEHSLPFLRTYHAANEVMQNMLT